MQEWMNVDTSVVYVMMQRSELGEMIRVLDTATQIMHTVNEGECASMESAAVETLMGQLLAKYDGLMDTW